MASWRDDARLPCGLRRCSLAPRGRSAAPHCRRHHAPVARDPAHCRLDEGRLRPSRAPSPATPESQSLLESDTKETMPKIGTTKSLNNKINVQEELQYASQSQNYITKFHSLAPDPTSAVATLSICGRRRRCHRHRREPSPPDPPREE
uniref:Uncharacterized protein n=1 Tax=Oryza glumipatula TaxID=40148 RepID=A0A0E0B0X3_9ORYZ